MINFLFIFWTHFLKLENWRSFDEALIGNIFLLIGELIKSKNAPSIVIVKLDIFMNACIEFMKKQLDNFDKNDEHLNESDSVEIRRKRFRQQSLSGRRIGT